MNPALTADEWRECLAEYAKRELHYRTEPGAITDPGDLHRFTFNEALWARPLNCNAHGHAALALHGQPFGFTREDVKACRQLADLTRIGEARYPDLVAAAFDRTPFWDSLADRIAALLPPEP